MSREKFVYIGVTEDEFVKIQCDNNNEIFKEFDDFMSRGYTNFWNDYIKWNYDSSRVHETYSGYVVPYAKAKNSPAVMAKRREEYYQSYAWAWRRNQVLYENNFVCGGCGGVATQCHHQDWGKKFGNYEHIGDIDDEVEMKVLVPVCAHCHQIITRIQNKRHRVTSPRHTPIIVHPYKMPLNAMYVLDEDDVEVF